jgi:hypothetical protein
MHSINDPRVAPVVDFGQLPKGIIFRQVHELSGETLDSYFARKMSKAQLSVEESRSYLDESLGNKSSRLQRSAPSLPTFFTEVEAIDVTLQIVNLLELLHSKDLVYSNLCPEDILLVDCDLHKMCLPSLFHCVGESVPLNTQ